MRRIEIFCRDIVPLACKLRDMIVRENRHLPEELHIAIENMGSVIRDVLPSLVGN
jgi:hypothetical protein